MKPREWIARLRRQCMPYDLYERHAIVARMLRSSMGERDTARVLDVGGRAALLGRFVPYRVTAINPDGSGNMIGSGDTLPFADASFEAVVSIDALEHVPVETRPAFLRECARVARRWLVLTFPYGSADHCADERKLAAWYRSVVGEPHVYLEEHVRHGLPDVHEVDGWLAEWGWLHVRAVYAGDYVWQRRQFERSVSTRDGVVVWDRARRFFGYVSGWALWHPVRSAGGPFPRANRAYLLFGFQHIEGRLGDACADE